MQEGCDQQAKIAAQSNETLFGRQRCQARLQCQDVEQDGGHRANRFILVVVLRQQEPLEQFADVIANQRYDAGHAQDGGQCFTTAD